MDLSYEARWDNLRTRLEDDVATLTAIERHSRAAGRYDDARNLARQLFTTRIALQHMDDLDRAGAHRA